ncbi:MAG: type II secretion system protein J [Candidatus Eiseniibacteriota bacterium]
MSRARTRRNGFTLLELLVAVSLMALIAIVLVDGIQFGARLWARTDRHVDGAMRWEAAHRLLRRELMHIYPYRRDERPGPRLVFDGTGEALHFVGLEPGAAGIAGLYAYTLALSTDGQRDLVLSWSMLDDGSHADRAILMRNVATLELKFFGAGADRGRPAWRTAWRNASDLPRLISVRVVPKDRRSGPPVELMVAPRLWAAGEGNT